MKIFHADDEPAFVDRVRTLVEPHFEWVGSVGDGTAIVDAVTELEPDVVLLDISMPGQSGLAAARELREKCPGVKLIMVTVHREDAYVQGAFRMGVSGYVAKGAVASQLVEAISQIAAGNTYVSPSLSSSHNGTP